MTTQAPDLAGLCERLRELDSDLGHAVWDRGCQSCALASNTISQAVAAIERLSAALQAAEARATDYRTVAINQGWNWSVCESYGREAYAIHRGEHVDACALNAAENRARTTLKGADHD